MPQFTSTDLRRGDTAKLSTPDKMTLEFGGALSPEGEQFLGDCMSLEFGGTLSPAADILLTNEMSREFGGRIRQLPADSIYTEEK
jgi:hypothetical protein